MITKFVLILLLTIICEAQIKINITVASNKDDVKVKFSGADFKLITDREIALFNITMANLNYGMRKELGRVPDGIYLKDPTPYGNLFRKYKWPEVKRKMQVEKVEIESVVTEETVLGTLEHLNKSIDDSTPDRSVFVLVENNVYSDWSKTGFPEEDMKYEVIVNFDNGTFKYQNKWREQASQVYSSHFGKSDKRTITIKPGQAIVKKLSALKTVILLHVTYTAQLSGNLIADYENLYGKYHFYAPLIRDIMRAGKIPNEISTTETMEIRCFTDPMVDLYDDSGAVIKLDRRTPFYKKN